MFRFLNAHGLSKLTAMSYDVDHRRLITAGQDDSIAIWNFSTGERLKTVRGPGGRRHGGLCARPFLVQ